MNEAARRFKISVVVAEVTGLADGRTIYFNSHDERSNASFWSIPASGGTPTLLVRVDDPARPSYRPEWALRKNRIYFTIDQRESDVWVVEIPKRGQPVR